jgi:hypothetical protein
MRKFREPEQFSHIMSKSMHIIAKYVFSMIKHTQINVVSDFYLGRDAFIHLKKKNVSPVKFEKLEIASSGINPSISYL